ncbi:NRAMP family divalent metal transporter [Nesterenkonia xinjiangensis]|uniref:Mn2+/Fe2+ NRAMP family transporter n=1 Tax=Nesterenkonia xinjiangensis TaxID=225327 RepID=A0A7Z0GPJ4_9MICC|nr:NRAMP family divalent metal transporter [Nesterenkonia xinjiangensis]NYJ78733.1 Mn2+/Fe2+ NRAMP family transporter [Nesterenkonia xinjiangensis]
MAETAPASAESIKKLARTRRTALLGAMFLMATSAVGPGFITQTATFTHQIGAAFAFAILISVLIDIAVQLNVWRVIGVSGLYAQQLGNRILPGVGWALAVLIFFGGIVFNIGNIAGAGMGLNALAGLDARVGGAISVAIALLIFLSKKAGIALDRVVVACGAVLILLMVYMAITTAPPVGEALRQTVLPEQVDFFIITTLVGGTVGGYITYAGAHRLIASGNSGPENVKAISRTSVMGIMVASIIRFLLFLAILGVVATGVSLTEDNVAAEAFGAALGEIGLRVFGLVFWVAAITSILGATFTTVSFLTTKNTTERTKTIYFAAFLALTCGVFLTLGQAPQTLLIMAGAFNGVVLPLGFTVVLYVAWRRRDLLQGYVYPKWLLIIGLLAWGLTLYMGANSLTGLAELWMTG